MPGQRWSRTVTEVLTERIAYKVGAFLLAVALWVTASGEEPAARYVTVRFAPVLDTGMRIVGPPPTVRALVEGPAGELLKLYAKPPLLRRAYPAERDTTIRVELRAADVDLPNGVARLRVRDVQPHAVSLRLAGARRLPAALPTDTPPSVRLDRARVMP